MRERFTISISDKGIADWLRQQPNISEYIRGLVEADMGEEVQPHTTNNGVLTAILEELQGLRRDLGSKAIVTVPEPSTRRRPPGGLSRQVGKFREGQR